MIRFIASIAVFGYSEQQRWPQSAMLWPSLFCKRFVYESREMLLLERNKSPLG
ncbi:hypothetical protein RESH_01133 [Rhodopirellula europaea SH398]|uniref:Uncharacterized protein n=1 Tax=Rhodopirellula europaea SH398 TaxID=1263868 RepID=M5SKR1_9BACT|nr:hypothetical protein RESH_01133 [Rhodopirellula europaea SH398]